MLAFIPTLALAISLLISPALARITNVYFPSTAYLGETLKVNITEESYIQQWVDLGALFGFVAPPDRCGVCTGQGQFYQNLYNETKYSGKNGIPHGNYTIDVPVPSNLNTTWDYIIVAAVPYYVGASGGTGIRYFNQSITLTANPDNGTTYD